MLDSLVFKLIAAGVVLAAVGYSYFWVYEQGASNAKATCTAEKALAKAADLRENEQVRQEELREIGSLPPALKKSEDVYKNIEQQIENHANGVKFSSDLFTSDGYSLYIAAIRGENPTAVVPSKPDIPLPFIIPRT